jgi:hypothetical protein
MLKSLGARKEVQPAAEVPLECEEVNALSTSGESSAAHV